MLLIKSITDRPVDIDIDVQSSTGDSFYVYRIVRDPDHSVIDDIGMDLRLFNINALRMHSRINSYSLCDLKNCS